MEKTKEIVKSTINRSVFNRAYKLHLEKTGKIRCSYCPYHKGENFSSKKYYGGYGDNITYPNWKLATKNSKQWMKKENVKYIREVSKYSGRMYLEIIF
jgi:hypothetical protein